MLLHDIHHRHHQIVKYRFTNHIDILRISLNRWTWVWIWDYYIYFPLILSIIISLQTKFVRGYIGVTLLVLLGQTWLVSCQFVCVLVHKMLKVREVWMNYFYIFYGINIKLYMCCGHDMKMWNLQFAHWSTHYRVVFPWT